MAISSKYRISVFLTALLISSQPSHAFAAGNQSQPMNYIQNILPAAATVGVVCAQIGLPECFRQFTEGLTRQRASETGNISGFFNSQDPASVTRLPSVGTNDARINETLVSIIMDAIQKAVGSNQSMKESQTSAKETANAMKQRTVENSSEDVAENPNQSVERVKTSLAALDTLSKQAQQIGSTEAESTQEYAKLILRQNTLLHLANVQKGEMLSRIHGELVKSNQNLADIGKILAEDVLANLSEIQKTMTSSSEAMLNSLTTLTNTVISLQKNSQWQNLAHQSATPANLTNPEVFTRLREARSTIYGFETGRQ